MSERSLLKVFTWWQWHKPAVLYLFLMRSVFMEQHQYVWTSHLLAFTKFIYLLHTCQSPKDRVVGQVCQCDVRD